MKVKLDENLPRRLEQLMAERGHDVATVVGEGLGGRHDATVAQVAASEGRMVITQDRRFVDIRRYPPGQHPGFIVLRPSDQSPASVERLVDALLAQYLLDGLGGCIVVVEPGSVRIRRP